MKEQQVWRETHESLMPPNSRCVKVNESLKISVMVCIRHTWYLAGTIRYWCQILQNYSLIVNNITFCIHLLMAIHFKFLANIINVEIAFLYGDLEEKNYMDCPQGMSDVGMNECIFLKQVQILKKWGLIGGNVNACQ